MIDPLVREFFRQYSGLGIGQRAENNMPGILTLIVVSISTRTGGVFSHIRAWRLSRLYEGLCEVMHSAKAIR